MLAVGTDATLGALTLSEGMLAPQFDAATTSYTASVGYTVSPLTVTPTPTDSGAAVAFLDASDAALADADGNADGHQVALGVGANVFKVKVTAEDRVAAETYAVTVTRTAEDTSLSPPPSDAAAAFQSTAAYAVTFQGQWTAAVTPGGVPGGAHFTRLIGAVHNAGVTFLSGGGTATAGVEAMAENGVTSSLKTEVEAARPNALGVLEGAGATIGRAGSTALNTVTLTTAHPRVTLVTMVAPSPDWFVGVSGLPLLDAQGNWLRSHTVNLYPWDAGTEEGSEFSLANAATEPRGTIRSIRGTGKFSTAPIATLSFARQSVGTARRVAENTAPGRDIGAPITVRDRGGGTVTYGLGGTDAAFFDVADSTGQLRTRAALDYETRNGYTVTVTASHGDGSSDSIAVTITVTDVNEAPAITGSASVEYPENGSGTVAAYGAADPENAAIAWTLSGVDGGDFGIDGAGVLGFTASPDYEAPADADRNNVYAVTVEASDGTNTATRDRKRRRPQRRRSGDADPVVGAAPGRYPADRHPDRPRRRRVRRGLEVGAVRRRFDRLDRHRHRGQLHAGCRRRGEAPCGSLSRTPTATDPERAWVRRRPTRCGRRR